MPRLFTVAVDEDEPKCWGCNWRVGRLYALAETQEEAAALYQSGDAGLCGDCIADLIIDGGSCGIVSRESRRIGRKEEGIVNEGLIFTNSPRGHDVRRMCNTRRALTSGAHGDAHS